MTKKVWLPADGDLLKKLRGEAKVEITTFARMYSLSVYQIKQLEEGGNSAFYSSAIKFTTGRKLLMHFGADVQSFESVPEQTQSLELEIPKEKLNSTKNNLNTAVKIKFLSPYMILLMTIFISLICFYAYLIFKGEGEKEPVTPIGAITVPAEEKNVEFKSINSTVYISKELAQINPIECNWSEEPPVVLVNKPSKPGDYIHVIANTERSICLRDATNKIHTLQLKGFKSQTIRGKAPFELFSKGLNEFKIFYQGSLLKLPNADTKSIRRREQKYE